MKRPTLTLVGIVTAALVGALAGCLSPLAQQRGLAALHSLARDACKADNARCAVLVPCATALHASIKAYQALGEAVAAGGDESAAASAAIASEAGARAACAIVGVK